MPNLAVGLGAAVWLAALADSRSLPDPSLTPGALNPAVTEATIATTICVRGWTRPVRPPAEYTEELKRRQIREYGYADRRLKSYEEDHLIPSGVRGSPADPRNLWPEPREAADSWNADRKDDLEAVSPGWSALIKYRCARRSVPSLRIGLQRIAG